MTAAATRKLQKEIEVVLKKVDDGIQEFDDGWELAMVAGPGQRERLGEELKKSINRLQRWRVQMREWLGQGGLQTQIQDKLEESRKRVESDMQRFKDFERDIKTKAFSTCALQREDELELEEAEKLKYQEWLGQTIQSLNDQLDQFEADLEVLATKRSLGSEEKASQEALKQLQVQHRWHRQKLEILLRAVDNDAVDMSDLALVRDSVDFYVDNNQEESCFHDETLYDCFDLTEFEDKIVTPKSPIQGPKDSPSSGKEDAKKKTKEEKRREDKKKDKKKEGSDKKGAGTPTVSAAAAKGAGAKVGDTKVGGNASGAQGDREEPEEIKVQEDQLLNEATEFICKICQVHVAGSGPTLTSCSHLFCGDCIMQWFAQHPESQSWAQRAKAAGPDRVVPCPVCKQPLNEKRDLYPVCGVTSRSENLLLWRMLSSLKIMCANHPKVRPDGKCEWIGEYGSYQKHALRCKNQPLGDCSASTTSEVPASLSRPRARSIDSESDACSTPCSRQTSSKPPSLAATPQARIQSPAASPPLMPQPLPGAHMEAEGPHLPESAVTTPALGARGAADHTPSKDSQQPTHTPASSVKPSTPAPAKGAAPAPTPAPAAPAAAPAATTAAPVAAAAASAAPAAVEQGSVPRPAPLADDKARGAEVAFTVAAPSSFEAAGANTLAVKAGDLIGVVEQHTSGWTYAKNLSSSSPSVCGWIPSWLVPQQPAQQAEAHPARAAAPAPAAAQVAAPPAAVAGLLAPASEARPVLRCCSAFLATTPSQLTLAASDLVEVVERHGSGWTYGRKVSETPGEGPVEGWFPDWVVAQK
mmetsp:Transcript_13071/g.46492  ORF Transcript_13071/g.46492 Transcript_13071/m.46492 type:complete len:812 (+) Transcript_13071:118-2553(+)|eukprot:CAMPEP_0203867196 /NCGR_PEP_ID=MMETSP0359-20131031/16379_1 /ASSEMBLY_ACC=CAM_ASM_000338 /TAXON_ID=268821 /ORGANISM="Scrippsiella Hangoei, Strain SHTV-5" /LENGTH=811 /DNA_ID=CAMNT_0050785399 /DNA_START=110 /DNA_END=2545 /DNA_ORIENTATION=-